MFTTTFFSIDKFIWLKVIVMVTISNYIIINYLKMRSDLKIINLGHNYKKVTKDNIISKYYNKCKIIITISIILLVVTYFI